MSEETIAASISLVLYGCLSLCSMYYFFLLRYKQSKRIGSNQKDREVGTSSKIVFFGVLAFSSGCDIPLYVACLANCAPPECEWNDQIYQVCWSMHLFSSLCLIF